MATTARIDRRDRDRRLRHHHRHLDLLVITRQHLRSPSRSERFLGASRLALWIAGATVIVKIVLALWTRRVGDQTRNTAVVALAADHRNDIFSALAATIGIIFGRMGFLWIDPLAAAWYHSSSSTPESGSSARPAPT